MRDKPEDLSGDIPWIRIEDFDGKWLSGSRSGQGVSVETVRSMHLKVFPPGTVLCSCSCNMGVTAVAAKPLVSNQTFIGLVPRPSLDSTYLYYLMQSARARLTELATGAIQTYLSRDDFRGLRIPVPPVSTQRTIAGYLDRKTAAIDALIEKKQRLIGLLTEKRAALMSHAVTKGLDPNAPMKDSGVPWIAKIPAHWELIPTRWVVCRLQTGMTPPTSQQSYYDDGTVPWYGPSSFTDSLEIGEPVKRLNARAIRDGVARLFAAGSVLIIGIGATLGKAALLTASGATNQQVLCVEIPVSRMSPRFAAYQFRRLESVFRARAQFTTLPIMTQSELGDYPVAQPSLREQSEIVSHLDGYWARTARLEASLTTQIDCLHEYRQALITTAVLGQIDVAGDTA